MSSPAIGIDLGTRNALAAFLDEDGAVRLTVSYTHLTLPTKLEV